MLPGEATTKKNRPRESLHFNVALLVEEKSWNRLMTLAQIRDAVKIPGHIPLLEELLYLVAPAKRRNLALRNCPVAVLNAFVVLAMVKCGRMDFVIFLDNPDFQSKHPEAGFWGEVPGILLKNIEFP